MEEKFDFRGASLHGHGTEGEAGSAGDASRTRGNPFPTGGYRTGIV